MQWAILYMRGISNYRADLKFTPYGAMIVWYTEKTFGSEDTNIVQ